jgi:hypothetical protein
MQDVTLQENHPLIMNLSFSISMGILPVTLALKTLGCGIKDSVLAMEQTGDEEHSSKPCYFYYLSLRIFHGFLFPVFLYFFLDKNY